MPHTRTLIRLLGRGARRPGLLRDVLRAGWRFRQRDWYRRWPFLPLPPSEYLAWRLHTAYGEEGADPPPEPIERYVRWTVRMNRDV